MIDTCDPTIACWSDDGETFVVKDPIKFETTIIPQFFKHSKFTSFVRVSKMLGSFVPYAFRLCEKRVSNVFLAFSCSCYTAIELLCLP